MAGTITATLAVEVFPVPPLVELTVTELFSVPPMVPVTFSASVQFPRAGIEPPERLTDPDPATAVIVPPQVFVTPLGVATIKPVGMVSVKLMPVRGTVAFELEIANVKLVLVPITTDAAPKVLVMEGGPTTVIFAVDVLPVPPLVELTVTELLTTAGVVPVTLTENIQLAFAASVAPVRVTLVAPAVAVIVPPPQVPVKLLGVETTNPAGMLSVIEMPLTEAVMFGLVMVKLRVAVPPTGIAEALKSLVIDGGSITVRVAVLEVEPVPPSLEVIALVVLFKGPPVVPVTFTVMMQFELAATVPPDRLTEFVPAVAVIEPPPQLPVKPLGVETTNPAGSVSVNPTPVKEMPFRLVRVKVRLVLPLSGTEEAPNALLMVGGPATVKLALAVLPVPPFVEDTLPVVLVFIPAVVPVTFTEIVQVPETAIDPPDKLTKFVPLVAVGKPPQVFESPFGVATTNPGGNVSANPTPFKGVPVFGFVIVKVRDVLPFTGISTAPNALLMLGGLRTVTLALPWSGMDDAPNALEIVGGPTTVMVAVLDVVP
jgi:hypothetical protein